MNRNYIAFMNKEELGETVAWTGLPFVYRQATIDGVKVYCYKTEEFLMVIQNNTIKINSESFTNTRMAKKRIQSFIGYVHGFTV